MQATIRRHVTDGCGRPLAPGTQVTLVESELFYSVDLGDGRPVLVAADDLRVACEVPGCERRATYDAPGHWCSVHWQEWWDAPKDRPVPDWMDEGRERGDFVSLRRDVTIDGRTITAGTPVSRIRSHIFVRVRTEDDPFLVDRADLSIRCEAEGCTEEAQLWQPCYCCRKHFYAWLDDDFPLPGAEKTPVEDMEVPAWRRGPGAGRPTDYPEMSARDQWAVDKRLGILDEEW